MTAAEQTVGLLGLVIADDHPLFRIGLGYALRGLGFDLVAEANDGLEAVQACERCRPHAVLLDVKMPRLDGLAACQQIARISPSTRIVMLTTFSEPALVEAARQAGAAAFISKETEPSRLARLVHALVNDPAARHFPHTALPSFSKRELEVLTWIGLGLSNKEVARELGLSPETIKDHLEKLYRKLEVEDRLGAITKARALGVLA